MNNKKTSDHLIALGVALFVGVIILVSFLVGDSGEKFNLLCSKKEKDGYTTTYYEVLNAKKGDYLVLDKKIADVTVSVSKITSSGGWDKDSLCSPDSQVDLAASDWEVLTIGRDCGFGASVESCDINSVEDSKGMSEFAFNKSEAFSSGKLLKISFK